jgi:hypothetical protein
VLFSPNVVNSGVSDLLVPPAQSMFRLFRIQLPLLSVVCLCWTMLFHGSSAAASCGNYLHTRQGPPVLHPGSEWSGPTRLTLRTTDQHLTARSLTTPRQPCTGPNCGRSKSPPHPLPAAIPAGTVERDDQCCLCRTTPEPESPALFAAPDRFSAWPSADPQPPDMPPDCSGWCDVFRAWRVLV